MNIVVNGELRDVADDIRLADVVALVSNARHGIAVAVNDAVVPRRDWKTTVLVSADRVEVLTAVQGG
jgi:sulfur carrier protein